MSDEFPEDNAGFDDVTIFWGTKDIDRTGESKWDPDFIGQLLWDEEFDMSTVAAQKYLHNFCDDMLSQEFTLNDPENYQCWIYGFKDYVTRPLEDPDPEATQLMK
jgi:protein dispatched 1